LLYTGNENVASDNITSSSVPSLNIPCSSNTAFNKKRKLNECATKQQKDEKLKSNSAKPETGNCDICIICGVSDVYFIGKKLSF